MIPINPVCESAVDDESRPEIFTIDIVRDSDTEIGVGVLSKPEHKHIVTDLVSNYKPLRARETDIKMTIILKNN